MTAAFIDVATLSALVLMDYARILPDELCIFFILAIALIVFPVLDVMAGGSPGKLIVHLAVLDKSGLRLSPMQAFGREMARLVSVFPFAVAAPVSGLLILLRKRPLRDLVASSFVVRNGQTRLGNSWRKRG
jgi:uncharacterized RDD family membrane protein YckC